MPIDAKILSSRRSYEFTQDDIRLSALCNTGTVNHIKEAFAFQIGQVGTPAPTFGPVPQTVPPGLIFDYGLAVLPGGQAVPIRFLHFEQRRIVLDIAGSSNFIDPIYGMLRLILATVSAAVGAPAVEEPKQTLDYSEITTHLPLPAGQFVSKELPELITQAITTRYRGETMAALPSARIDLQPPDEEYRGLASHFWSFSIALRQGTRPQDRLFFSSAPLDSESHISLLERLASPL